ncbi:hypothetical protein EZE46_30135 [Bacillus sp. BH2]|uniref:hypothetical protein n=1 Tax=Bacillus TaxID=1386 RepID=UPI001066977D|nr:hypothetical protein [Bacillus sp. BH2]TEA44863.1 hypothetical protein EZE46_30135 [Bacillus sp. BH2]
MTKEQHKYHVTFYLSNGKEISGRITHSDDINTSLEELNDMIKTKKTIQVPQLGIVIRTKYITHIEIIEVAA